jgi:general secretion pathway protein J
MSVNKRYGQRGFTLIEMVIAVALSALVAAMAYESFDGASRNAARTREVLDGVNKLDKAWQLIGQDMRNIVPLNAELPNPQVRFEAASQKTKGKDTFQVVMVFARRGWVNPLGRMRSDLQQVNYRVAEGKLWRDYLPERNLPLENIDFERDSFHQLLLGDVIDVQVRFLSEAQIKANGKSVLEGNEYSNAWEPTWPPINNGAGGSAMPVALEISIELEGVGRSARLFEIPQQ